MTIKKDFTPDEVALDERLRKAHADRLVADRRDAAARLRALPPDQQRQELANGLYASQEAAREGARQRALQPLGDGRHAREMTAAEREAALRRRGIFLPALMLGAPR